MVEEASLEFKLRRTDETRNYLTDELVKKLIKLVKSIKEM